MIKPSNKISELLDQFNKLEKRVEFIEKKVKGFKKVRKGNRSTK